MKGAMVPLQESKRIVSIDILRGLAILGIFLVNMPSFHSPLLYIDGAERWAGGWDGILYRFSDIVAQASFYPLFAFLFGFGAIILAVRSEEKGISFPLLYMKRLSFLLILGCIHAFFIWHGDILINYAVFGFALLFFYKMKGRNLILLGSVCYVLPFAILGSLFLIMGIFDREGMAITTDSAMMKQSLEVYQSGTFPELMSQRALDWYMVNNPFNAIILFLSIFPFFLMGAGVAKQGFLQNPTQYNRQLKAISIVSLLLGMSIKMLPYVTVYHFGTIFVQDYLGGPLLTIFYITAITILAERAGASRLLHPLSYIGRMSMSNYLFQSMVCTGIFYSYGLGLYGSVSYTTGFVFLIALFCLQTLLSLLWMGLYKYGPVEYIWRFFTYGKKPVMRR
ncbi:MULTISPECIES: DUF418 domain-containing protein [unclassified Bacillus (in: firmicutes)]|uniref:DUF418 domain-containing protein n=1 Tax=unclassified Bacillus (in: firmicutes) TaxID=185979 RepID=UPI001BE570C3|nr:MULTISPECIES: DUF418 domain-containing protein [unclassified Bacillus (in: firmicutes)]MBT2614575.1 DUF418 domain-containing protein [Bacillus sp. ISL-78]MBT2632127.1 DUF418 domain-containing protein [Bacillus sp. ISL-101]MBT2715555.1 DUF418 domain-containing protein [Bacillus sp. ISL-57]